MGEGEVGVGFVLEGGVLGTRPEVTFTVAAVLGERPEVTFTVAGVLGERPEVAVAVLGAVGALGGGVFFFAGI